MRALESRIPPPFLVIVIGAAMALAPLVSSPKLPTAWSWGLAAAFFLAAALFAFPAFAAFGRADTTIDPVRIERASVLVVKGVYRYTRNPMYVALALLLCAWAAWLARLTPCIGPLAFVLFTTRFQIVPEERVLASKFGNDFEVYRRSVRRWL